MLFPKCLLTPRGLPSDSTCVLEAEAGKLGIKRCEPGFYSSIYPLFYSSNYRLWHYFWLLCWFSVIGDVIQKVQRHHDLIKTHAVKKTRFIRQRATMQLIWEVTDKSSYVLLDSSISSSDSSAPEINLSSPLFVLTAVRFLLSLSESSCVTLVLWVSINESENIKETMGAQWLSGRVLDSRLRGCRFKPHRRQCVVVLEQDTFILAQYWFNPGRPVPV